MTNPWASSSSSSSNPFSGTFTPKFSSGPKAPTLRQALMQMELDKKKNDYSLGALIKRGAKESLNPVLWAFDKIMRPSWAVASAVSAGLSPSLGKDPGFGEVFGAAAHGAREGFMGRSKKGFGEVLDEQGVLPNNPRVRGALGFYADVAYDPLMLASTAAAPVTGGSSLAAYTALKTGAKAAGKEVAEATLRTEAKKAAYDAGRHVLDGKVTDDAIEVLEKAGPDFQARLGLAKTIKAGEKAHPAEKLADNRWFQEKAIAQEIAYAEERRVTKRVAQFRYGTQRYHVRTPAQIKGRQVAPTVPKFAGVASRNIPVLSKLTNATGERFIPGFRRDELHAAEMARLKVAQVNNTTQVRRIEEIMQGRAYPKGSSLLPDEALNKAVTKLDKDDQLHALALFETPLKGRNGKMLKAVIKKDGKYVLNEKYIQRLLDNYATDITDGISPAQAEFVRRFHDATQFLYGRDQAYGVKYKGPHLGESGRLYVPHRFTTDGAPINLNQTQKNIFSAAGFQKLRGKTPVSVRQLDELVKKGDLPKSIETDPYKLLTSTSRARAEKQADMVMIRSLEQYIGIPTRIVDEAQMAKATARLSKANKALTVAEKNFAKAEEALETQKELAHAEVMSDFAEKIAAIEKKIRSVRYAKLDNKKLADKIKAINTGHDTALAKLERAVQAKVTKLGNAVNKARIEADKAEEAAERAIKSNETKPNKAWVTRATKLAATKMDLAEQLEEAFEALPKAVDPDTVKGLAAARDRAIEKAKTAARVNQKRTKKATITVMENRIEALKVQRGIKLDQLSKPTSRLSQAAYGKARKAKAEAFEARAAARKEVRAAVKAGNAAAKGKRNPKFSAKQHRKLSQSTDEWGNDYAYPPEVADSMERLRKIVSGDEKTVDDFARGYGRWMSTWKLLVTVINPGYRFRNSMTDFWNMWVAGVPAHQIAKNGKNAAGLMRRAKQGDLDAIHEILEAATHGVLSGLFAGDVAAVAKMIKYSANKKTLVKNKQFIRLYTKVMTDVNKNAENWGRLTHYMYRKNWQNMSGADAALKVKLAHFDYEDLTPFEQRIMKKIFPFYTWTRKNIPYQVRMLVQQPGRYSAFPKMAQEAGYASGDASDDLTVPDYASANFYMRIGKNRLYNPQFGPNDLAALQGPSHMFNRLKGMITPAAKIIAEPAFNQSMFTGQPISGGKHPRDPVSPIGAGLLGLLPGNPANVGTTTRGDIQGPGANPWAAYALGQTPLSRFIGITSGGIKKKQAGTDARLSYLLGLSTQTVDEEAQKGYKMKDAYNEADQIIQGLRDAGLLPPAANRKLSKREKAIQTSVFGP